jgi:hypothetical protein
MNIIKKLTLSLTVICTLLTSPLLGAINCNQKIKLQRTLETHFFLLGQNLFLDQISRDIPSMSLEVMATKLTFQKTFSKAPGRIKSYLIEEIGASKLEELETRVLIEYDSLTSSMVYVKESAESFLSDVLLRSQGQIPSPFLETLLHFQFEDSPEFEMDSNFYYRFRTKDHPKAKGTDWQIQLPASWKQLEGNRPNIIQKFVSDYGDGLEGIMLSNGLLPTNVTRDLSPSEIEDLYNEELLKDFQGSDYALISFTKMTFDGIIGCCAEYEFVGQRLDQTIALRNQMYIFMFEDRIYSLTCSTSSLDGSQEDSSKRMKKFTPLFRAVANSIVVMGQYE